MCGAIEEEKLRLEKAMKRKGADAKALQTLWNTMEADSRKLAESASLTFSPADRYMDLIYPDFYYLLFEMFLHVLILKILHFLFLEVGLSLFLLFL